MCDQCAKQFITKYGLTLHKKTKHDKIYKRVCQICQKGFNQNVQYRFLCANHLNVTLEKYSFCRTEFTSPGYLMKHLLICKDNPNHSEDVQFVCPVCFVSDKTWPQLSSTKKAPATKIQVNRVRKLLCMVLKPQGTHQIC